MAFIKITVKCKAKALIVICLLLSVEKSSQAIRTKPTPCPDTFSYEESDADDDRWHGDITLKIDKNTVGATLRITLDKPSQLLVSWAGAVSTPDNIIYIASHDDAILYGGMTHKLRIMVKFDKSKAVPSLKTIHFNSRQICPSQNVEDVNYPTPVTSKRPDLYIPDPTDDLITGLDRTSTTLRSTTKPRPSPAKPISVEHHSTSSSGTPNPTYYRPSKPSSNYYHEVTTPFTRGPGVETSSHSNVFDTNQGSSRHVPCGTVSIANPLITHGQKTQRGQWPWHTALYKTEGINLNYLCGGSLVSKNKVVTAAHCLVSTPGNKILSYKSLVVYLGKYNLRQYTGETGVQVKEVSRLHVNPTYNSSNYQGDIAILTLSSDVEFTNYVRPVCLWEETNSIDEIEGKEGVVAGWGLTELDQTSEELKMATLPVVSTETCLRSYPKFYSEYLGDSAFCAGFRNGTSPCNGDSGGGLVFKRNKDTWYLRGIVSLSVAKENLNFCDPNYYVIFTDTARYVDFIRKNVS